MATTSDTDKSPRAANQAPPTHVAEVSNYEIVSHYFEIAADRLGLEDDVRAVLRSNYREVQVQIPIRQTDGQDPRLLRLPRPAQRARAGRTRAACATTRTSTSTRCARSPRS